jgi:hypothetical protein
MLKYLGFMAKVREDGSRTVESLALDGAYGPQTESVVIDFQGAMGLLRDGKVGPITMEALENAYSQRVLELNTPGVDAVDGMPDRYVFERVRADKYEDGYDRLSLRQDVATAYNEVRDEVCEKGAILTSSAGVRSLHATTTRSRSRTSFHYLGRALDLYIYSGMINVEEDPYVIAREEPRVYRVYARCDPPAAEVEEIENAITYDDRKEGETISGSFIDLTERFREKGFEPIKARPHFEDGGSIMGAEWWHFQYEEGLVAGVSTFGSELQKVYSTSTLEGTEPWRYREKIFQINWF